MDPRLLGAIAETGSSLGDRDADSWHRGSCGLDGLRRGRESRRLDIAPVAGIRRRHRAPVTTGPMWAKRRETGAATALCATQNPGSDGALSRR